MPINRRLTALALAGLSLLTACAAPPAAPVTGEVTVAEARLEPGRLIVTGATTLPDDVCLLTRLMAGPALVPDWSVDCVTPAQGAWTLSLPVGAKGDALVRPGVAYDFLIWLRDQPEISGRLAFTLGAPAGQP